jgi:hypothetical protein
MNPLATALILRQEEHAAVLNSYPSFAVDAVDQCSVHLGLL